MMQELVSLGGDDGFIDRFLFFVARPVFHPSSVTKEFLPKLRETGLLDVVEIMTNIYEEHVKGCLYTLSREAEQTFEALTDSYAEFINSKYGSDEEEEKENEMVSQDINMENTLKISSKDTTHILRLSAILHIVQHKITGALEHRRPSPTPTKIQRETLKQAMMLYNAIAQQKSLFMQAVESCEKENAQSRIRPSMTFRDRVFRVLCSAKSPCVSVRCLQNHLKGSLAQNIKIELELIERQGFGKLKTVKTRHGVRDLFYKLHPSCIDEEVGDHQKMLKSVSISLESYSATFEDMTGVSEDLKMLMIQHHPQAELIESLW